jgi:Shelterin complex subunit, TPP1/ACD
MSVKEFFAFANIKIAVVEYLKMKADYETLPSKHKKPFRAHINKHSSQIGANLPAHESENAANSNYTDYFASDGFNSIRCIFSQICKESFERLYPASIKIYNTVNMLICIQ